MRVNKKADRRTDRTRAALLSAFAELILSRGYANVAIGDVARRANVGRSTFYLHYANKEALLKESVERPCGALAACVRQDVTPRMLLPLLEHVRGQRIVNRPFFQEPLRSIWVRTLAAMIERNLAGVATTAGPQPPVRLPRPLLARVIAEMQIALLAHTLLGDAPAKLEDTAQALLFGTRALLTRSA